MSENTVQSNNEPIDICFGMMNCDERGNVKIPPQYSYKITFQGKDCMVIPLEGVKLKSRPKSQRKETTQARKTKVNNKEETGEGIDK